MGRKGDKGRWVHEYALGQASQQMVRGKGRVALKAAVPVLLHKELFNSE